MYKWIGNERRKRKLSSLVEGADEDNMLRTEMVAKCPPAKRMTSGYNMFSSKNLSSGTKCIHTYTYVVNLKFQN